jgi:hypothetical protein
LVILYGLTKDRWRWQQVARISALALVLAGVIIGGLYLWKQLPATISPQTEYASLRLGIGPAEVMYIKGYPPQVLGEAAKNDEWPGQPIIETKNLESGKRPQDYRDWSYSDSSTRIDVTFNAERTAVVAIACYSNDRQGRCPSIGGVTDGDSEQEVIRKLGTQGWQRITDVTKNMRYPDLGIELWLAQERVYMLGIHDRKYPQEDR